MKSENEARSSWDGLPFTVWLTSGLWNLQVCHSVTTAHPSVPMLYKSLASCQHRCSLQVSFPRPLGGTILVANSPDSLESSQWKRRICITLGNWEQLPIKRNQLLHSMFSVLSTGRDLSLMYLAQVTILPNHLLYQLLCFTSPDFNHRDWFYLLFLFFPNVCAICELYQQFYVFSCLFILSLFQDTISISCQASPLNMPRNPVWNIILLP